MSNDPTWISLPCGYLSDYCINPEGLTLCEIEISRANMNSSQQNKINSHVNKVKRTM